ncbi:MAG: hypothetical protein R3D05_04210 [Dongiaceae bacterium]
MMFATSLSREEFLGWIGGKLEAKPVRLANVRSSLSRGGDILLVWREKPDTGLVGLPGPLICMPQRDIKEFFAFTATYISTYQPFSAFFRVVSLDLFDSLVEPQSHGSRLRPNQLMGAVIAEASVQAGIRGRALSELAIQACLATFSYAAMLGLSLGLERRQFDILADGWIRTRTQLTDEALKLPPAGVREFWSLVLAAQREDLGLGYSPEPALRRILRFLMVALSANGHRLLDEWGQLTDGLPSAQAAILQMIESREDRVRALDGVLAEILTTDKVDKKVREVVAGYLCSQVAGGSIRFLELLQPITELLPMSAMWFGLFTSIHPDTDVLTSGDCLGRRIVRHAGNIGSVFDMPRGDLSADELLVLMPERRLDIRVRTEHSNAVSVEVFPTIYGTFRIPREIKKEPELKDVASPAAIREVRYHLQRLSRAIEALSEGEQKTLFGENSKYAYRPKARRTEK